MTVTKQWSLCCFSTVPSFDSYELDKKTAVNKAKRTWEYTLKESNYHSSLWSVEIQSAVVLWTLFFRQLTHTHAQTPLNGLQRYGRWFLFFALGGSRSHEDSVGVC